jgi:hypothetical protein
MNDALVFATHEDEEKQTRTNYRQSHWICSRHSDYFRGAFMSLSTAGRISKSLAPVWLRLDIFPCLADFFASTG